MAEKWISKGDQDVPDRKELLALYKVFQDRQQADLDMLHRYANYYVAALLAILAAFILALARAYDKSVAGFFVVLPAVSIMLVHHGQLMTFRFYRRYTEGKVRITKIEYLLGLYGPVSCKLVPDVAYMLWEQDQCFLPDRYISDTARRKTANACALRSDQDHPNQVFVSSAAFIRKRSTDYGVGYLIQTTFEVFRILYLIALVLLPSALLFTKSTPDVKLLNAILALAAAGAVCWHRKWYERTRYKFEGETPRSAAEDHAEQVDTSALKE